MYIYTQRGIEKYRENIEYIASTSKLGSEVKVTAWAGFREQRRHHDKKSGRHRRDHAQSRVTVSELLRRHAPARVVVSGDFAGRFVLGEASRLGDRCRPPRRLGDALITLRPAGGELCNPSDHRHIYFLNTLTCS
nr:hypothetical protein Iba_chr09aCG14780 [Ipomoea batatas]GME11149.1 hypothetical protein Iba_scaffold11362CG0010 [Ipomoea batatas]